jgi:site-specific DNA-cytosine methylase
VSSFADGFSKQPYVAVKEMAWIEWALVAMLLLKQFYDASQWCLDFFDYSWREWSFTYDLVVTAGPSCCPFSVSGKRLRQEDPRASQSMERAQLAVLLGALVLIVENVTNFVDEDHMHHLVQEMDSFLLSNHMVAVGTWRLVDSALGMASNRVRVFLRWEREDMASSLPPLNEKPDELPGLEYLIFWMSRRRWLFWRWVDN